MIMAYIITMMTMIKTVLKAKDGREREWSKDVDEEVCL
jgi:hypothetical protein